MAARSPGFRTFSEPKSSVPGVELALEKNHGKDGVEERGGEREEKKPHG
jgi:hypothetical protein